MATAMNEQTLHQQQPGAVPTGDKTSFSIYNNTAALEKKIAALESNSEQHHNDDGTIKWVPHGFRKHKTSHSVGPESFYTTLREEIQASAPIQLSPPSASKSRMPSASLSSSLNVLPAPAPVPAPVPTEPTESTAATATTIATRASIAITNATSTCPDSDAVNMTGLGFEPTEQSFSNVHACTREQQPECPVLGTETPKEPAANPWPPTTSTRLQHMRQENGSNQDQVQNRNAPDPLPSYPLPLPAQIQHPLSPPPATTLVMVESIQDWSPHVELSGSANSLEKEGATRPVADKVPLGKLQSSGSLNFSITRHPLSNSARSAKVSATSTVAASKQIPRSMSSSAAHRVSSHQQGRLYPQSSQKQLKQLHHPATSSSSWRTLASERVSVTGTGRGSGAGVGGGAGVGMGSGVRRPSMTSSHAASTSYHDWSESMPTRPQPSRTTKQHTFIPMRSLGRSQSYDDKISTVTATTTTIQPPASVTITQAGTEVAPAAGQDQPWDEAQFNQVAQSLKTLLEEYEELSNRILESLILTATQAEDVYKSDPEQGQGNGDNEGAHTGSHDTNVLSLTGSLGITGNHPSLLRTKAGTGSRKGKARQQSDSPLPSLMSDTAPQEADLEQLPMHRFEGQSWPPGLLRRQRLARSATVWIATEWPKVYATHQQQIVQPTSSGMIRKQIDAIACIKEAISTLWSLDSQSHELSTIVINILRDPEELVEDTSRLLKSRHLDHFAKAPTLSTTQIDSLDHLMKADYDRRQMLSEPLNNIWVSLLMLESSSGTKVSQIGSSNHLFPGSLSALFFPMPFSSTSSTATVNQEQLHDTEQVSPVRRRTIFGIGRNKRFVLKVAILLLLGAFLIGMGLLINTRS